MPSPLHPCNALAPPVERSSSPPLQSDVCRVKLPSRYSSNFRSDKATRNCNDVFGRLTYRLGNLFIRVATCEVSERERVGARQRREKCMESSASCRHPARETETSVACATPAAGK